MEAKILENVVPVTPSDRTKENMGLWLTVDIPNGWEDCKKICKKGKP